MKHTKILIGIVLILVISIPAFLYFIYTDKPLTKNTSSTINIENKETDTNDSNNNSNSNNSTNDSSSKRQKIRGVGEYRITQRERGFHGWTIIRN